MLGAGLAEAPPAWGRLAALVTDAREQLAELVPPNGSPAAAALRLQLHDKLETVGPRSAAFPLRQGTCLAPTGHMSRTGLAHRVRIAKASLQQWRCPCSRALSSRATLGLLPHNLHRQRPAPMAALITRAPIEDRRHKGMLANRMTQRCHLVATELCGAAAGGGVRPHLPAPAFRLPDTLRGQPGGARSLGGHPPGAPATFPCNYCFCRLSSALCGANRGACSASGESTRTFAVPSQQPYWSKAVLIDVVASELLCCF